MAGRYHPRLPEPPASGDAPRRPPPGGRRGAAPPPLGAAARRRHLSLRQPQPPLHPDTESRRLRPQRPANGQPPPAGTLHGLLPGRCPTRAGLRVGGGAHPGGHSPSRHRAGGGGEREPGGVAAGDRRSPPGALRRGPPHRPRRRGRGAGLLLARRRSRAQAAGHRRRSRQCFQRAFSPPAVPLRLPQRTDARPRNALPERGPGEGRRAGRSRLGTSGGRHRRIRGGRHPLSTTRRRPPAGRSGGRRPAEPVERRIPVLAPAAPLRQRRSSGGTGHSAAHAQQGALQDQGGRRRLSRRREANARLRPRPLRRPQAHPATRPSPAARPAERQGLRPRTAAPRHGRTGQEQHRRAALRPSEPHPRPLGLGRRHRRGRAPPRHFGQGARPRGQPPAQRAGTHPRPAPERNTGETPPTAAALRLRRLRAQRRERRGGNRAWRAPPSAPPPPHPRRRHADPPPRRQPHPGRPTGGDRGERERQPGHRHLPPATGRPAARRPGPALDARGGARQKALRPPRLRRGLPRRRAAARAGCHPRRRQPPATGVARHRAARSRYRQRSATGTARRAHRRVPRRGPSGGTAGTVGRPGAAHPRPAHPLPAAGPLCRPRRAGGEHGSIGPPDPPPRPGAGGAIRARSRRCVVLRLPPAHPSGGGRAKRRGARSSPEQSLSRAPSALVGNESGNQRTPSAGDPPPRPRRRGDANRRRRHQSHRHMGHKQPPLPGGAALVRADPGNGGGLSTLAYPGTRREGVGRAGSPRPL